MAKSYKVKNNTAAAYGMKAPEMNPFESPLDYLKRIEKAANERMNQLEKLSTRDSYKAVKDYAYKNAVYDIEHIFNKTEKPYRFGLKGIRKNKDGTYNEQDIRARINSVERFLASPSSTKRGIDKIYKKRAQTLNDKYGTNYSWEEWLKIFKNKQWDRAKDKYGSDVVMLAIAAMEDMDKEEIEDLLHKDLQIADDEVRDEQIKTFISEMGLEMFT